jgi:dihydroneopterin aldolase
MSGASGQPGSTIFDPGRDHVCMIVRDLAVEISIGLHPWERTAPQRVIVNVEAWACVGPAYKDTDAPLILDYDRIRDVIRNEWPKRPHVNLLEPLAEELIALCFGYPSVVAARVRVEKPDIFPEAKGVGIELYRRRPA